MVLRQKLKRLSVLLTISDPEELGGASGVYVTKLTHPKLQGELSFVHSENVGRDQVLKALDENLVGHILDLVDVAGEMLNVKQKASPSSASDPARREQ